MFEGISESFSHAFRMFQGAPLTSISPDRDTLHVLLRLGVCNPMREMEVFAAIIAIMFGSLFSSRIAQAVTIVQLMVSIQVYLALILTDNLHVLGVVGASSVVVYGVFTILFLLLVASISSEKTTNILTKTLYLLSIGRLVAYAICTSV